MKIILSGKPSEAKILTDDGLDITRELCITDLVIEVHEAEWPQVTMKCLGWSVDVTATAEQVAATVVVCE